MRRGRAWARATAGALLPIAFLVLALAPGVASGPPNARAIAAAQPLSQSAASHQQPPAPSAPEAEANLSPTAYARALQAAARSEGLPPPVVVVATPGAPTVIDHRPLLPGSPYAATPGVWQELAHAAARPAPARLRGGPADQARLRSLLGPGWVLTERLERIGEWATRLLEGWFLRGRVLILPDWVEPLLGILILLFLTLTAVGLGVAMVRQFRHLRAGDAGGRLPVQAQVNAGPRDSAGHLQAARAAAAAGDLPAALGHIYAAVLLNLARQGHLRLQHWRTGRSYLHELQRAAPPLAPPFAELTDFCERRWYGGHPSTPDDFSAALALASPLLGKEVSA